LYRYSEATRKELQDAISALQGRVFIPHQAASEFLRNRLSVTSDQSKEYTSAIKAIKELVKKISSKERHPFISDDKLTELNELSSSVVENLELNRRQFLINSLTHNTFYNIFSNLPVSLIAFNFI